VFYSLFALILLFYVRQNRENPSLAVTGSKETRATFGWGVAIAAGTGFAIEAVGGILHSGEFFFQLAHEAMYFAFLIVGLTAVLESRGKMPNDSWRMAMAIAFFVEGLVFYGHMLEQEGTEQMVHFIMVMFSWFTAFCFVVSVYFSSSLVPHVFGTTGMLAKGVWFFIITDILYSGKYGDEGQNYMLATGYTVAGVLITCLFSFVGCCMFSKPLGAYDDLMVSPEETKPVDGNKYLKVDLSNDA